MAPGFQSNLLNLLGSVTPLTTPQPVNTDAPLSTSPSPLGQLLDRASTGLSGLILPQRPENLQGALIAGAVISGVREGLREAEERARRDEQVRQERLKEEEKYRARLAEERKKQDEERTKRENAERMLVRAEAERDQTQQQHSLLRRRVQQVVPGLVLPPPFPATVQV